MRTDRFVTAYIHGETNGPAEQVRAARSDQKQTSFRIDKVMKIAAILGLSTLGWGCAKPLLPPLPQSQLVIKPYCERTITAEVVALDQVYYYNRFGAFNPAGIMYALRRDVVHADDKDLLNGDLDSESDEKEQAITLQHGAADLGLAGKVKLRSDKRPRPLVLRANEGDCLQVTFTNLLSPEMSGQEVMLDPEKRLTHPDKRVTTVSDSDEPSTRHASMHVNGLSLVDSIDSQGANVGKNGWHDQSGKKTDGGCLPNQRDHGCALAAPGETRTYTWYAKKEGTFFFYSMGAPAGGEGDGGQLGLGLFGAINVQPRGARWYRSQVTEEDLKAASHKQLTKFGQPVIDYEATYQSGSRSGDPILNMLKCQSPEHPR